MGGVTNRTNKGKENLYYALVCLLFISILLFIIITLFWGKFQKIQPMIEANLLDWTINDFMANNF